VSAPPRYPCCSIRSENTKIQTSVHACGQEKISDCQGRCCYCCYRCCCYNAAQALSTGCSCSCTAATQTVLTVQLLRCHCWVLPCAGTCTKQQHSTSSCALPASGYARHFLSSTQGQLHAKCARPLCAHAQRVTAQHATCCGAYKQQTQAQNCVSYTHAYAMLCFFLDCSTAWHLVQYLYCWLQ
jgi:hypothetical protein